MKLYNDEIVHGDKARALSLAIEKLLTFRSLQASGYVPGIELEFLS